MKSDINTSRIRPAWRGIALAVALASCLGRSAMAGETKVFEWRDAKGVVSYSQSPPPPGTPGVSSLEITTQKFTPAQRAALRAHLAHIDATEQADSNRYQAQVAAADQAVNRALRSLSFAERAAREARAPLAGERIGNAGGGSRLRSEYFDRQQRLEDAVGAARAKVEEAYRLRGQLMP